MQASASSRWARAVTVARSLLAGAAATLADISILALLVGALGLSARLSNLPALLVGATVQFLGNRHFAFRAASGRLDRQLGWFAATEVVAFALNGLLFELVAARVTLGTVTAVGLRALVGFAVFAVWSYPLWRRIFRTPPLLAQG